jgi:hypothetical protein
MSDSDVRSHERGVDPAGAGSLAVWWIGDDLDDL